MFSRVNGATRTCSLSCCCRIVPAHTRIRLSGPSANRLIPMLPVFSFCQRLILVTLCLGIVGGCRRQSSIAPAADTPRPAALEVEPSVAPAPANPTRSPEVVSGQLKAEQPRTADQYLSMRQQLDQELWSAEVDAQRHEEPFIRLWDALRTLESEYTTVRSVSVSSDSIRATSTGNDSSVGNPRVSF